MLAATPTGAVFSPCRRWRYLLWRRWDEKLPVANFLMLNPSTADEHKLDPTCARARDYAERWGLWRFDCHECLCFQGNKS